jgi:hypothetical protein
LNVDLGKILLTDVPESEIRHHRFTFLIKSVAALSAIASILAWDKNKKTTCRASRHNLCDTVKKLGIIGFDLNFSLVSSLLSSLVLIGAINRHPRAGNVCVTSQSQK